MELGPGRKYRRLSQLESTELQTRKRGTAGLQVLSWEVVEAEIRVDGDGEPEGGKRRGKEVSSWCLLSPN